MSKHRKTAPRTVPVTNKKTGETQEREALQSTKHFPAPKATSSPSTAVDAGKAKGSAATPSATDSPSVKQPKEKKEAETLEQFIEAFYKGKVKSLPDSRIRKLKKQTFDVDTLKGLVDSARKIDSSLDRSRYLFALITGLGTYATFRHSVSEFVRDVVVRHPVMVSHKVERWFPVPGSVDGAGLDDLYEEIGLAKKSKTDRKPKETGVASDEKKVSAEFQKARLNAFYIAALWRYNKGFFSFEKLLRVFRSTVYKSQVEKAEIEEQVIDFLVSAQGKEVAGLSSLMQWHSDQVEHDRRIAESASRKADSLSERLAEINVQLASAKGEIAGLNEKIRELHVQLQEAAEKARVQSIHTRADQQSQKGRTLRILEEEIPVIADCLTALERDPPKVAVASEYMSSVLEKLTKELNYLKGE